MAASSGNMLEGRTGSPEECVAREMRVMSSGNSVSDSSGMISCTRLARESAVSGVQQCI